MESLDQHPGIRLRDCDSHVPNGGAGIGRFAPGPDCRYLQDVSGTKELSAKAVLAGGGMLHRLGLSTRSSYSIIIRRFFPTFSDLVQRLPEWKNRASERKFIVEVASLADAELLVNAGVDGIQFDKLRRMS